MHYPGVFRIIADWSLPLMVELEEEAALAHGTMSILQKGCNMAVVVCESQSGAELTLCLLLMEVSNPFLHSRFLMKVNNNRRAR